MAALRSHHILRRAGARWPQVAVLLVLLATWPVTRWTVRRALDGSDTPWGLAAVAVLLVLAWRRGWRPADEIPRSDLVAPTTMLLVYALSYNFVLPLVRGALAVTIVALLLSRFVWGRRLHLGVWGLCLLTLPLSASLHFYLGYPLRALVTVLAAGSLRMAGLGVDAQGAALRMGDQLVLVDAPCAGINMLWVAALLACVLMCTLELSSAASGLASIGVLTLVVFGNALRAASLFYLEAGLIEMSEHAHAMVGVLVFGGTAAATCQLMVWMKRVQEKRCIAQPF